MTTRTKCNHIACLLYDHPITNLSAQPLQVEPELQAYHQQNDPILFDHLSALADPLFSTISGLLSCLSILCRAYISRGRTPFTQDRRGGGYWRMLDLVVYRSKSLSCHLLRYFRTGALSRGRNHLRNHESGHASCIPPGRLQSRLGSARTP